MVKYFASNLTFIKQFYQMLQLTLPSIKLAKFGLNPENLHCSKKKH